MDKNIFKFSPDEVCGMMQEELEKCPEDMDTEFIDLCIEALETAEDHSLKSTSKPESTVKTGKKTARFRLRKVLLVAAVIAVVFAALPTAFSQKAQLVNVGDMVSKRKNFFDIDFSKSTQDVNLKVIPDETVADTDVMRFLSARGINTVILPKELLSDEYDRSEFKFKKIFEEDFSLDFKADNIKEKIECEISLRKWYTEDGVCYANIGIADSYNHIERIEINGMDVIVLSNGKKSVIYYYIDYTFYEIYLNCDFDTAMGIAKTIE